MDEEIFHVEDFDPYEWIENRILDCEDKSDALHSLLPELTLLSQSLTKSIHITLHQVNTSIPQIQNQLELLERLTVPLTQRLDTLSTQINIADNAETHVADGLIKVKDTEKDLNHLMILHEAKHRLTSCKSALLEAAKWEKNVRLCYLSSEDIASVQDRFTKSNALKLKSISERMEEMKRSLEVMRDMPGAVDRKNTLQSLFDHIEKITKPKLLENLREEIIDTSLIQEYVLVFSSIDRVDIIKSEYAKCRQAHVHRMWFSFNETEADFSDWLTAFYHEIVRMLEKESVLTKEIFGEDAGSVLLTLIQNTFFVLQDSFRSRLQRNFRMKNLIKCFRLTCKFIGDIHVYLENCIKLRNDLDMEKDPFQMVEYIFDPYRLFFKDYSAYASEDLTERLTTLIPQFGVEQEDGGEGVIEQFAQRLEDISSDVWNVVEDEVNDCYLYTSGAAFPGVLEAISISTEQFMVSLIAIISIIRDYAKLNITDMDALSNGYEIIGPDWSKFQGGLALLRSCGVLQGNFDVMANRVTARMHGQLAGLLGDRNSESLVEHNKGIDPTVYLNDVFDPSCIPYTIARLWIRDNSSQVGILQELNSSLGCAKLEVFADTRRSLSEWINQVHLLTYDTILVPVQRILQTVPRSEVWIGGLGDLPSFSMIPQEYITTVADIMLSLLPQLQLYAESSSISRELLSSQGAYRLCTSNWNKLGNLLELSESEMRYCKETLLVEDISNETSLAFVDLWTSVVASGTLASVLNMVCSISTISKLGCKQLSADLDYFRNVLNVLGGEKNFLLNGVRIILHNVGQGQEMGNDQLNELSNNDVEFRIISILYQQIQAKRQV